MNAFVDGLTEAALSRAGRAWKQPLRWVLLSNGGADLNDNVIFLGFERGAREPSLAAKVPRLPSNGRLTRMEYERHLEIWNLLGADAARRLPEPLALVEIGGQAALLISWAPGEGLLHSPRRGLWRDSPRLLALAREAARSLREVHDRASKPLEAGERVPSDLPRKIQAFRELFSPNEDELRLLSELAQVCSSRAATRKTLIQGDFWHGNLIRGAAHGGLVFIDWQYARWDTDVSLDVYLFLLAGALANVSAAAAEEKARRARELLERWRVRVIPAYLAAYGRPAQASLLPARYGMLLCCVEKATRAALDFGYNQSDAETWRRLFAELGRLPAQGGFFDGL